MFSEKLLAALGEFWHVTWILALLIAGISVLVGFMREYIPQEKFQKRLKNQKTFTGALSGAALGILTPFCSASMVPIGMGMIEMSAPFSTVLPFFISAPLCNFVVVGIIFGTFGWNVALIYFIWTFCGAVIAGLTVGRSRIRFQVKNMAEIIAKQAEEKKNSKETGYDATQSSPCCSQAADENTSPCCTALSTGVNHKEKVSDAFQFALALFKKIMPYVLVGAAISGFTFAFVPNEIVERYVGNDSWYAIPIAAAISIPLYLRIEMAIPLLMTLLGKGMGMGAAIALLISGTGASLPEFAILSSMLKPKAIVAFAITVFVIATTGGFLFMFINF